MAENSAVPRSPFTFLSQSRLSQFATGSKAWTAFLNGWPVIPASDSSGGVLLAEFLYSQKTNSFDQKSKSFTHSGL